MNSNLKKFTTFLNESQWNQVPEEALSAVLKAMRSSGKNAIQIYTNLSKFPKDFVDSMRNQAQKEGTTLEEILDNTIKKDPTILYYLNDFPEIKQQVLDRTGVDDLSNLGFLLDTMKD